MKDTYTGNESIKLGCLAGYVIPSKFYTLQN